MSGSLRASSPIKVQKKSRSRSGCKLSKQKHLKCDETHPACLQCQKRKAICPGYDLAIRWSDKYEGVSGTRGANGTQNRGSGKRSMADRNDKQHEQARVHTQGPEQGPEAYTMLPPVQDYVNAGLDRHDALTLDQTFPDFLQTNEGSCTTAPQLRPQREMFMGNLDRLLSADASPVSPLRMQQAHLLWQDDTFFFGQPFENSEHGISSLDSLASQKPSDIMWSLDMDQYTPESIDQMLSATTTNPTRLVEPLSPPPNLLEHFFQNTCGLIYVFDSPNSPCQYLLRRYAKSSSLVRSSVVSVASVCSCEDKITNAIAAHRKSATTALTAAISELDIKSQKPANTPSRLQQIEQALLAVIMIGTSSQWLGHLKEKLGSDLRPALLDGHGSFVVGLMAYWETCMAFLIDQPLDAVDYLRPFASSSDLQHVHPHPWTGIGTSLYILLARTGVLVRQKRMLVKLGWDSIVYAPVRQSLTQIAIDIEECCTRHVSPSVVAMKETGDPSTTYQQLEKLALITKLATLVELYKAFPQLCSLPHREKLAAPHDALQMSFRGTSDAQSGHNQELMVKLACMATRPYVVQKWRKITIERLRSSTHNMGGHASYKQAILLMEKVWERVDAQRTDQSHGPDIDLIHWIDVMEDCKLTTFIG
ncbi:hypothetical protein EJ08DRAFT_677720 [Tothia fuscella]|uniref:Zn(2)-C6 fungal-type domain-containing protein n=1 Tax=Tothia fuscella TaxID=1048955 RepID=A0A9P4U0Q1_9PEZI|nr:hypothetical protein EJ08DRAFT_677720 [Tothia fuscella]